MYKVNLNNYLFYALLIIILMLLLGINPFLKYPFDMYAHLEGIDKQYSANSLSGHRVLWYWIWAKIFHLFSIDNSQVFLRAYFIHYSQILISFGGVFYFSYIFIKNFFKNIDKLSIKYLALWSTLIWFTVYATNSMGIHQVWILWYSINYQITLVIVLVMLGLTISIFYENQKFIYKIFYLILVFFMGKIVLQMHVMELLYYIMYIFIFSLVYIDKIYLFLKKHKIIGFAILITVIVLIVKLPLFVENFESKSSRIIPYLSLDKMPDLYTQIMRDGAALVNGLNRANASMNELIYISLFFILLMFILYLIRFFKNKDNLINSRLLLFLILASSFVLIPVFQFTSGLAGMLVSSIDVVNRFYYSSLIFLVIPLFVYSLISIIGKKNIIIMNILIISILLSTFIYSRFDIGHNQNYYKNIKSLIRAYNKNNVGFNLSNKEIEQIALLKEKYKKDLNISNPYFFAREDIAFVLKHIYNENADMPEHYNGGLLSVNYYIKDYNKSKRKNKILFKTPKDFSNYAPFK